MLDIAANRIKKIENISHLTELQEFWVSRGQSCSPECSVQQRGETLLMGSIWTCVPWRELL